MECYLALTAAELAGCREPPEHMAWMACHFSPYGTGLSNFPEELPPGSLLILNDRTPICGHDPGLIRSQLEWAREEFDLSGILLDLQRPGEPQTQALAAKLTADFPCPVGVSAMYARDLPCPVFPGPIPPSMVPGKYLAPWKGREIWLDVTPTAQALILTEAGCLEKEQDGYIPDGLIHWDPSLLCRYRICPGQDQVTFDLARDKEALPRLLEALPQSGVTKAVGLYQALQQKQAAPEQGQP